MVYIKDCFPKLMHVILSICLSLSIRLCGVRIILDFVSEEEEKNLLLCIDEVPWDPSQSGRRKQVGSHFVRKVVIIYYLLIIVWLISNDH